MGDKAEGLKPKQNRKKKPITFCDKLTSASAILWLETFTEEAQGDR